MLNLIVIADLNPGKESSAAAHAVDKDSLDEFLRQVSPTLEIPPAGGKLTFKEFKDFRPERLVERVPSVARLISLRSTLLEAAEGKSSLQAVRDALAQHPELARLIEPALVPKAEPPPPTGNVFDLVDAGPSPSEGLINAVLGNTGKGGPPPAALRRASEHVDRAIAPLLRSVLHHPAFLELEAAWRGLRYLVRSIDFRADTRLHVLASPRRDLLRAMRDVALPFADDLRAQGRVTCLVLDFTLSADETAEVAHASADRVVPVIAAGEGPAPTGIALAANRFLLRLPYGASMDKVKGFEFEEQEGGKVHLWGRAGWVAGALLASSFARTGWGVDFIGQRAAEALEPLPLAKLETEIAEGKEGILPLAVRPGLDRAFAVSGGGLRSVLFAAQLFASLESLLGHLDLTCSLDDIARTIGAGLQLLGLTEGGSVYTITAEPIREGRPAVKLTVRPGAAGPLRGLSDLSLEVPIPLVN